MLITNQPGKNQARKNRAVFTRRPVRYTLELLAIGWLRLEQRWEDNPGFFAATAAGSLGLLLATTMLFNAWSGWLQESPDGDDVAVASPDTTDDDLGEANDNEILFVRGRHDGTTRYLDGDDTDTFADSKMPGRRFVSGSDDEVAEDDSEGGLDTWMSTSKGKTSSLNSFDDDEATEDIAERSTPDTEDPPRKIIGKLPVQKPDAFEDDDDAAPDDEPVAKRPLTEMRVASQPQVLEPVKIDEEEEISSTEPDELAETESKSSPPEPARLMPQSKLNIAKAESNRARPIDDDDPSDDDALKRNRSIDLTGGPAGKAAPRDDSRWKQQRSRSAAESAAPAVAARQSRPVETKIFAPAPARSMPAVKETRTPRENSATPLLRLAISGPPAVGVGQSCQVEIRVTNTGSVPAQHLVVSAELPEGLVHEVAQSLEQPVATLAPGATYRALLRLRGKAAGEKTIRAEVSMGEQPPLKLSARVRVTPASEAVTTVGSADCFCAPLVR